MKFCPQCGTQLDSNAHFCVACGAKQPKFPTQESPMSATTKRVFKSKKEWNWKRKEILPLIRASVITLMALVMVIMAFLPIVHFRPEGVFTDMFGLDEMKIKVSAVQNTVFLFDTFKELDEEDLYESDFADELVDLSEDLEDILEDELSSDEIEKLEDYKDLPGKAKKVCNRIAILSLRMGLQSEEVVAPYSLIVLAIFSVLYLLLALAAFAFSVFHLLSVLGILKWEACKKPPIGFFFSVPMMLLLLCATESFTFGESGVMSVVLSGTGVTSIVLSAIVLAVCVAYLFLEKQIPSVRSLLWRIPAVVVAIVLLSTLGGSVFNTRVKTYFPGKNNKQEAVIPNNVGFFNELILSEPKFDELDEWSEDFYAEMAKDEFKDSFDMLGDYTKKELERGEANIENLDLLLYLGATHNFHDYMGIFGMLPVLYIVVALGACLVLWQNVVWLAGGKYRRDMVIVAKIASLVAMLAALVMVIVYLAINSGFVDSYMPGGYRISIGAGVIASTIFALGALFCPSRVKSGEASENDSSEMRSEMVEVETVSTEEEIAD